MPIISIVGRGLDPAKHLSLSGLRTLQKADKIVGIESEIEFWQDLQEEYGISKIEDIGYLYDSQVYDMVNYNKFVDCVLSLSKEFYHLALLVPGHPRLGVTFIELLKKKCPENVGIEIIEGLSSFDLMIN